MDKTFRILTKLNYVVDLRHNLNLANKQLKKTTKKNRVICTGNLIHLFSVTPYPAVWKYSGIDFLQGIHNICSIQNDFIMFKNTIKKCSA